MWKRMGWPSVTVRPRQGCSRGIKKVHPVIAYFILIIFNLTFCPMSRADPFLRASPITRIGYMLRVNQIKTNVPLDLLEFP